MRHGRGRGVLARLVVIGVSINLRTVLGIYGLTGPAATLPFMASGVVLLGWA
jgi:hypothetical protein